MSDSEKPTEPVVTENEEGNDADGADEVSICLRQRRYADELREANVFDW